MVLTSESHQALLAAAERFVSNGRARLGSLALEGDVPGIAAALRRGRLPELVKSHEWSLPPALRALEYGDGPERLGITDGVLPMSPGIAFLRPPSLVIGVDESGRRPLPIAEIRRLTVMLMAEFHLSLSCVAGVLRAREGVGCESVAMEGAGSTGKLIMASRNHGEVELCVVRRLRLARIPDTTPSYSWSEIVDLRGPSR